MESLSDVPKVTEVGVNDRYKCRQYDFRSLSLNHYDIYCLYARCTGQSNTCFISLTSISIKISFPFKKETQNSSTM